MSYYYYNYQPYYGQMQASGELTGYYPAQLGIQLKLSPLGYQKIFFFLFLLKLSH